MVDLPGAIQSSQDFTDKILRRTIVAAICVLSCHRETRRGAAVLYAGMCSTSVGATALVVALVVGSLGTYASHTRGGRQTSQLKISIIEAPHFDNSGYSVAVRSQLTEGPGSMLEARVSSPASSSEETSSVFADSVFAERFSSSAPSASFDQRFVGRARALGHVAVSAIEAYLSPSRDGTTLQNALAGSTPHEASTTGSAGNEPIRSGPTVAASAAAIPRSAASPSQSNAARAPKVRLASLTSLPDSQNRTAIYDISSRVVYLPDGRRLEAHSGLGGYMDDPRYVAAKNQGPTPPNTYRLALRENPFHGVRAIRLIPVGDGNMFGRDGILAHHYLLGATGASNGCVSFANYPEFLNAYLNGDIDRLVVVERLENPPGSMLAADWFGRAVKGLAKVFDRGT